jgi:hypothetical protein
MEKVITEWRVVETDDGFRVEIKGDKEAMRSWTKHLKSCGPRFWRHHRMPFGPWGGRFWGHGFGYCRPWGEEESDEPKEA